MGQYDVGVGGPWPEGLVIVEPKPGPWTSRPPCPTRPEGSLGLGLLGLDLLLLLLGAGHGADDVGVPGVRDGQGAHLGQGYGMVRYGMVWYGMVWYGMAWYGYVWYGMVWYSMVW